MTILIVGLGSIAAKHIKAIRTLEPDASIYALRSSADAPQHEGVANIYAWSEMPEHPDFILISNPTRMHGEAIEKALEFNCPLLIEKPVLDKVDEELEGRLKAKHILSYVACNLRFHPCIKFLKDHLASKTIKVNEVNVYCGSDLSTWRPGTDYSRSYSARTDMGGGVHLDLIHEIDYCYWLFGKPQTSFASRRKVSNLHIDSVDYAAYQLGYEDFSIGIVLNYFRKKAKRSIEVVTEEGTFYADLLAGKIYLDDVQIFDAANFKMEETYLDQMKYFVGHLQDKTPMMNDFSEAMEVLKITLTPCA